MLARKLRRELWGQRNLTLTVAAVLALGVALFEASAVSYLNLVASYAETQGRLALADLHLEVDGVTTAEAERVAALPEVAVAEPRLVTSLPLVLPEGRLAAGVTGRLQVEGRFHGLPDGRPPRLDKLLLREGPPRGRRRGPGDHRAALRRLPPLEAGLAPEGRAGGVSLPLTVCGVASSAEFVWVTRSRSDIMPSPAEFGAVWVERSQLQRLVRRLLPALITEAQRRMAGLDPRPWWPPRPPDSSGGCSWRPSPTGPTSSWWRPPPGPRGRTSSGRSAPPWARAG